jgi:hypothetical protein
MSDDTTKPIKLDSGASQPWQHDRSAYPHVRPEVSVARLRGLKQWVAKGPRNETLEPVADVVARLKRKESAT